MPNEQTSKMIDSIILDCNDAVKVIVSGNYIAWCNSMVKIVQKLSMLKDGISKENIAGKDGAESGE